MIKKYKWTLLITSVVILLPILAGLILWEQLPEQLAIHWGPGGNADGYGSRALAVFGLPVILLALQWLGVLITAADKGSKHQSRKVTAMGLWIIPVLSLFVNAFVYAAAYGMTMNAARLLPVLLGVAFVVIGNYLPKCTRSYTMGIKIKWTLEDEDNWNATHRLTGRVWTIGGLVILLAVFLPVTVIPWAMLLPALPMVVVPVLYSYLYYRRRKKAGFVPADPLPVSKYRWIAWAVIAVLLLGMLPLLFTGEVQVTCGDTAVTVDATFYTSVTVDYEAIDRIQYRPQSDPGIRTMGFYSPRLLLGAFENEEFGAYTRYTYTRCPACVVLTVEGKTLVLNGKDVESTRNLYEDLLAFSGRLSGGN